MNETSIEATEIANAAKGRHRLYWLPNALTVSRIVMIPFLVPFNCPPSSYAYSSVSCFHLRMHLSQPAPLSRSWLLARTCRHVTPFVLIDFSEGFRTRSTRRLSPVGAPQRMKFMPNFLVLFLNFLFSFTCNLWVDRLPPYCVQAVSASLALGQ